MNRDTIKQQFPDVYLHILSEGIYYGVQGFIHIRTMDDIDQADKEIEAMHAEMMADYDKTVLSEHIAEGMTADDNEPASEGCPDCGSYEGCYTECPECGRGQ